MKPKNIPSKNEKKIEIDYQVFEKKIELSPQIQTLLEQAEKISSMAYAPYSRFQVGCAIELDNGTIITGNNQENVAYPSGLCAERVAIFAAHAKFPDQKIKAIAIFANALDFVLEQAISPCGACRQVLLEYQRLQIDQSIPIYMQGKNTSIVLSTIEDLLPFAFLKKN